MSCKCYGLYDEEKIIGFIGIIHQPNKNKRLKRVSRLVILPDYQGIGLGTKFLNKIAELYKTNKYDMSITTSAKNMIYSLKKDNKWIMIRYSINKASNKKKDYNHMNKTIRNNCYTASFMYKK